MTVFSKKIAPLLACAAILGGFAVTPSAAGVIAPAEKETIAAESPLDFVGWRRICHYNCRWAWRPSHGCVVASDYPRHWCHRRHYCGYASPVYVTSPGWGGCGGGWGWGGGWGGCGGWGGGFLGGLFPFL